MLDTNSWQIFVSHPKGEGSWATADYAFIAPPARQAIVDFLAGREAFVRQWGRDHEALAPFPRVNGALDYWPDAMLGKLKAELERRGGVRFNLKAFRATFAQRAKDRGAGIEAVSRALRHSSTVTTERYYARIRTEDAFAELEQAYLVQKSIHRD